MNKTRIVITYYYTLLCLLALSGCTTKPLPSSFAPEVSISPAESITRTSAILKGKITSEGKASNTHYTYCWSNENESFHLPATQCGDSLIAHLDNLSPGTSYRFYLEASNGYESVQSTSLKFQTIPNQKPSLSEICIIGSTPQSILLNSTILDDGGSPILQSGFVYQKENSDKEQTTTSIPNQDKMIFTAHIQKLEENTTYSIRSFASNSMGISYSPAIRFHTTHAITTNTPGFLPELIKEEERYQYTTLKIIAPLNGSDIRLLRDMAGKDINGNNTPGQLSFIDLSGSSIVGGGLSFNGHNYTSKDTLSTGIFSQLEHLKEIILPLSATTIEENAFSQCRQLEKITLPVALKQITASSQCPSLAEIILTPANNYYKSDDGILYNFSGSSIIWYPQGLYTEQLILPETLHTIGPYALEGCTCPELVIPNSVKEIAPYAFWNSKIETIQFPEQLTHLQRGVLQNSHSLHHVILGSGIEYLADYCFDSCPLKTLTIKSSSIPYCNENTFTGIKHIEQCILYVPKALVSKYRTHDKWKVFTYIMPITDE